MTLSKKTDQLLRRGVTIPCPESIEIGSTLNPDRISDRGVQMHTGCRITGRDTFIASGARIGTEGPVTLDNCYVGPDVELKSGHFKKAVFLERASLGYGLARARGNHP